MGLINLPKVPCFLDVAVNWDPRLTIAMAVAVIVTTAGYRFAFGRGRPVLREKFELPTSTKIDARLAGGAAVFGVGWGLAGFYPGARARRGPRRPRDRTGTQRQYL